MKKAKAGVEDILTPDEDVELELRTSAPQEEMEKYYRERRHRISKEMSKYGPLTMTPSHAKNIQKLVLSEKYTVIFYTVTRYAVFRYFEEYEGDVCDISRSSFMYWLSSEEEKMKLLSEGTQQAEARQKNQEERRKMDERDAEVNKKIALSIINTIKIK